MSATPVHYRIHHLTEYQYSSPVQSAHHLLHLAPRPCIWQAVTAARVEVSPLPTLQAEAKDTFGNPVRRVELTLPHDHLQVDSEILLAVDERPWANQVDDSPPWEQVRDGLSYHAGVVSDAEREALMQRFESPGVRVKQQLEDFAAPMFNAERPVIEAVTALMNRIHADFAYDPAATEVGTTVLEVLERKRGVCQDFAHLMIGSLRAMGLAARYVSGYLRTDPPEGQPRRVGADASHAWVAVYVPDLGWVEFDPTNDCLADQQHIVLAWGRDFTDVSPIRGVIQGGGTHTLKVAVTVTPLDE